MKKVILKLLFSILIYSAFGQSNHYYAIIKTHPVANFYKKYNLGIEIGKDGKSSRLTFSIFKTYLQSSFPFDINCVNRGIEAEGLNYRFGIKSLIFKADNLLFYLEPQFRYTRSSGLFYESYLDGLYNDIYNVTVKDFQFSGLAGFQILNKKKWIMIDFYSGLGTNYAKFNGILKKTYSRPNPPPIGTVSKWKCEGINIYFGTSIGLILGKYKSYKTLLF